MTRGKYDTSALRRRAQRLEHVKERLQNHNHTSEPDNSSEGGNYRHFNRETTKAFFSKARAQKKEQESHRRRRHRHHHVENVPQHPKHPHNNHPDNPKPHHKPAPDTKSKRFQEALKRRKMNAKKNIAVGEPNPNGPKKPHPIPHPSKKPHPVPQHHVPTNIPTRPHPTPHHVPSDIPTRTDRTRPNDVQYTKGMIPPHPPTPTPTPSPRPNHIHYEKGQFNRTPPTPTNSGPRPNNIHYEKGEITRADVRTDALRRRLNGKLNRSRNGS